MDEFIGTILGLFTFFAFPIFEYVWKKIIVIRYGNPKIWFLPDYCFRLIIRNIPWKVQFYDIRYKTVLRKVILPTSGSSVETYLHETVSQSEELFLPHNTDQVLLSFRIEEENSKHFFIHTDKIGKEINRFDMESFDCLITDYSAHLDGSFHFDIFIGRRVIVQKNELIEFYRKSRNGIEELSFEINEVQKFG